MAEMTEGDRLLAKKISAYFGNVDETYLIEEIAAYRESCVADERAARVKAEQERDEARSKTLAWITARQASEARVCEVERELVQARARIRKWEDHEVQKASCCDDNEQRAIKAEARLRAVIEAADRALRLHGCGEPESGSTICDRCAAYRRVRDAHASPEPDCKIDVLLKEQAEASKQAGHEFVSIGRGVNLCGACGLPWSQHGGRDAE